MNKRSFLRSSVLTTLGFISVVRAKSTQSTPTLPQEVEPFGFTLEDIDSSHPLIIAERVFRSLFSEMPRFTEVAFNSERRGLPERIICLGFPLETNSGQWMYLKRTSSETESGLSGFYYTTDTGVLYVRDHSLNTPQTPIDHPVLLTVNSYANGEFTGISANPLTKLDDGCDMPGEFNLFKSVFDDSMELIELTEF